MSFLDEDIIEKKDNIVDDVSQFVTFTLNNNLFAVNIFQVQEIINIKQITKVPNSPEFVEGVIDVRDMIIPILNLKKRFNLVDETEHLYIILVNVQDKIFGIHIDNVSEVLKIKNEIIHDAPEIVSGISRKYIDGIVKIRENETENLIILLDLAKILDKDELQQI